MTSPQIHSFRRKAFECQNGNCFYCGVSMWLTTPYEIPGCKSETPGYLKLQCTAEHLVARKDGGRDVEQNIVAACAHCNATRHKRKLPPEPEPYQREVQKRVALGSWHQRWVHDRGLLPRRDR
jgi:5-methylcytosine-specific restriction endonuclease McrA